MLDIERVMGQERLLRVLTGMSIQAFVRLIIPFYEAYQEAQAREATPRQRAINWKKKNLKRWQNRN